MTDNPYFTIGLMTYNNAAYIEKAIESIITQKLKNWELIISDDNSQDNTSQIVDRYLGDPRIRYIKHPSNLGQANNWKYLIKNASGKVFATLHADDYWDMDYLEIAYTAFTEKPLDILQFNWKLIDPQGNITGIGPVKKSTLLKKGKILENQLSKFTCLPSATLFNLKLINYISFPDNRYKYAVDFEYFIRMCSKASVLEKINEQRVYYRVHTSSVTALYGKGLPWDMERKHLIKNMTTYFGEKEFSEKNSDLLKLFFAKNILQDALSKSKSGYIKESIDKLKYALNLSPKSYLQAKILGKILINYISYPFKRKRG